MSSILKSFPRVSSPYSEPNNKMNNIRQDNLEPALGSMSTNTRNYVNPNSEVLQTKHKSMPSHTQKYAKYTHNFINHITKYVCQPVL